ncbi:MAG: universal stress protein [Candidatus Binatia bacterium]|jgi:universal stress protein A
MPRDFKTILCATDFSDESYRALEYGLRFARISEGTLLLAHILHNPVGEEFHPEGYELSFDQVRQHALHRLQDVQRARLDGYPRSELLVDIGDPYEQLMAITRQRMVDLIVTATHGRTGLNHLVMGSVAEKIIRHAPCPVFVVRRGAA